MSTKTAMAARFTEITLEDMDKFLKRAFRVLHPKRDDERGEYIYDLFLSTTVGIRVMTSVSRHADRGRAKGMDAIRVQLFNFHRKKPLRPGKWPIVKRTQGWRDNLRERIEDMVEAYDDREDDIEAGRYVDWGRK